MPLKNFDSLWDYNDPAGTELKFRELLPEAEAGGDRDLHAQLLTQIARTLGLQRRFDEAHALLDTVESMLGGSTPVARIRYLLERGRTYNSAGDKEAAKALFLKAWELGQAAAVDKLTVDAAHMIAITEPLEEGLEWNMRAIAFAEHSEQEGGRSWLGSLYNNTGWSYHDLGDYETALDLFERALAFREQQGSQDNIRIAKWCIARCLRSLERVDEALAMQEALLEEARAASAPDGYTQEEMGELLLLKGNETRARAHFKTAYELLSQDPWMMENEAERMKRMKRLAGQ